MYILWLDGEKCTFAIPRCSLKNIQTFERVKVNKICVPRKTHTHVNDLVLIEKCSPLFDLLRQKDFEKSS